jgi:hypothetical protein
MSHRKRFRAKGSANKKWNSEESYQRSKKCKPLAGAPAVGIIFLLGNKLLIDRTPERNARHRGFESPAQQSQKRVPGRTSQVYHNGDQGEDIEVKQWAGNNSQ